MDNTRKQFEEIFTKRGYNMKRQEAGYIYEAAETEFASRGFEAGYNAALSALSEPDMVEAVAIAIEQAALNRANSETPVTSTRIVTNEFATAALQAISKRLGE